MRFAIGMLSVLLLSTALSSSDCSAQWRCVRQRAAPCGWNGYYPPARWQTQLGFSYPSTYDPTGVGAAISAAANLPAGYVPKHMRVARARRTVSPAVNPIPTPTVFPTPAPPSPQELDILAFGATRSDLKTLLVLAKLSGLDEELEGTGPYTIFAPSDEAFAELPAATLDSLKADPAKLKDILMIHGAPGSLPAAELAKVASVNTLAETSIPVRKDGASLFIGRARVIEADIQCTNGVVHVIDKVLLPAGEPD